MCENETKKNGRSRWQEIIWPLEALEGHTYTWVMANNSKLCDARELYSVCPIVGNYFTGSIIENTSIWHISVTQFRPVFNVRLLIGRNFHISDLKTLESDSFRNGSMFNVMPHGKANFKIMFSNSVVFRRWTHMDGTRAQFDLDRPGFTLDQTESICGLKRTVTDLTKIDNSLKRRKVSVKM